MTKGPGGDYDSGTYMWSFVTQILHSGQPSHGGDRTTFEKMINPSPILIILGLVVSISRYHHLNVLFDGVNRI
jgi:hypothetical protein